MIELLKSEVQRKLGVEIKGRGECQLLSDAISYELGDTLNYNTLRRFFGVDKNSQVKPSRNTLDLLSMFLGYSSYNQFSTQIIRFGSNQYKDNWYTILNKSSIENMLIYLSGRRMDSSFVDVFIRCIRELLLMGRIDDVDQLFKSKLMGVEKFSYSESVFIGNSIGILMRDLELSDEGCFKLLKNENFVHLVFSIFVDYSGLNLKYGNVIWLAQSLDKQMSKEDVVFFRSLHQLRKFLLNEKMINDVGVDFESFDGHPILIGRIASVEMLCAGSNKRERLHIFERLKQRFLEDKVRRIDYFYEVSITALILSDFELINMIDKVRMGPHITQQYQISHNQLGCISKLVLFVSQGKYQELTTIIDQIKKELWVTSYFEFFDVFYLIARFHSTDTHEEKEQYKMEYLKIVNRMNYRKFDETYLENYFEESLQSK